MVFTESLQRLFLSVLCCGLASASVSQELPDQTPPVIGRMAISISRLPPDSRGGKAYRLSYRVPVPVAIMWKFKTDFENDFLLQNDYIKAHRLISRQQNSVVTEDRYSQLPAARFTWQTILSPSRHRLDFKLLNAQQVGQRFHYGHIQLETEGAATRVTQVAYFDFLGASLWAEIPWRGGMVDFLTYGARWERDMVIRRRSLYAAGAGQ